MDSSPSSHWVRSELSNLESIAKEPLPVQLYSASQTRQLDRCAIDEHQMPGLDLMKKAGGAAFQLLKQRWPQCERIAVFCGRGNNGGDGYVLARLAHNAGIEVMLYQVGDTNKLAGDALALYNECLQDKVPCETYLAKTYLAKTHAGQSLQADVLVDGLLGTGLNSDVGGEYEKAVIAINESAIPCLALDIPSGLSADTGRVLGVAVKAECTITFIACKQGLLTGEGTEYSGELYFDDLGVPAAIYERIPSEVRRVTLLDLKRLLPSRKKNAHKGSFGHVLVVGGDYGMAGAVIMAAESAMRCGAGLVSVATHQEHLPLVVARCPEVMCHSVESDSDMEPLLSKADVIVVGPGLGRSLWSEELLNAAMQTSSPVVLDADGLNLLSAGKLEGYGQQARNDNWILTPHPGEAARLLGVDIQAIQEDRFRTARALQNLYGGAVVLKGPGTIICAGEDNPKVYLTAVGNPGMASGGMGDVLSGIIGALLAQGLSLSDAASLGPFIHGLAADLVALNQGERGLLATDLMQPLRQIINYG
ncbi:MAG: NAD(P)H-hydrate dehydratase [Pseudomonadales bacterium]|nr:NAD(P)H-hydrate dehydratase [Pseudomonadales bacterium]